jgi:hypothetical protein
MLYSKTYGLQKETRNYLRRLYTFNRELDSSDIADLDSFIKGAKQLGIWQNMICWPLRSQHNLGSGSTVLSLGGLGNYNGSMVNSPTWGSNAITFTGSSSQAISVNQLPLISPRGFSIASLYSRDALYGSTATNCGFDDSVLGTQCGIADANNGFTGFAATLNTGATVGGNATNAVGGIGSNTYNFCLGTFNLHSLLCNQHLYTAPGSYSANSGYYSITSSIPANTTIRGNATSRFAIGRWGANQARNFNGKISATFFFTIDVTNVQSSLYNLIKTTIGKGLGLP